MTTTAELNHTRSWMDTGTALFTATVDRLTDADLAAADPPARLVAAARGRARRAQRPGAAPAGAMGPHWRADADVRVGGAAGERHRGGGGLAARRLRSFLADTAVQLATDLDRLPPGRWAAEVMTAQGRTITAREIPWLRTREVAVHAVDLAAGPDFEDLPGELCAALVTDAARLRSSRGHDPALRLRSGDQAWLVTGTGEPAQVEGTPAALARWLTGRGTSGLTVTGGMLPPLSPWL